ncbi:7267_t:CDS:2, partial [Scutellospora calospora]
NETILEKITSLIQDLLEICNAAVVQVQKAQDTMKDKCNKNIKKWSKLEIGDKSRGTRPQQFQIKASRAALATPATTAKKAVKAYLTWRARWG